MAKSKMVFMAASLVAAIAQAQTNDLAAAEFPMTQATVLPQSGSVVGHNEAYVHQVLDNKVALILQSGTGNWASIQQTGANADQAYINQAGNNNRAMIVQR